MFLIPSFMESILKYVLAKYTMSLLHFTISLTRLSYSSFVMISSGELAFNIVDALLFSIYFNTSIILTLNLFTKNY